MAGAKIWKDIALTFAGKLITAGWSAVKACALVGLHRTAWYRHLSPPTPAGILVPHVDRAHPNRISDAEAEAFMKLKLAQSLGITLSYSRPRVSDDNPYSESLFRTVKYDLDFPGRFRDIQHARDYMTAFFANYNANHRHSGLNYYTPDLVHNGHANQARLQRQTILDAIYARHPQRFRNKPAAPAVPSHAGINHKNTIRCPGWSFMPVRCRSAEIPT
jgi:hypothetical protein